MNDLHIDIKQKAKLRARAHTVRVSPENFEEIWYGNKAFVIGDLTLQNNQKGDVVTLKEDEGWPQLSGKNNFTGREIVAVIGHITTEHLQPGYGVISLTNITKRDNPKPGTTPPNS